jgi:hypothetical protein
MKQTILRVGAEISFESMAFQQWGFELSKAE